MIRLILFTSILTPFLLSAQISITPKIGFEYGGLSYYPKSTKRNSDIRIARPEGEALLAVDISILQKDKKLSLSIESKNLLGGVAIHADTLIFLDGFIGSGNYRNITGGSHLLVGFMYEKINFFSQSSKYLSWSYGGGLAVGFNRTERHYRETQDAGYHLSYWGGTNFCRIERWTKPTGHGIFLRLRGGISLHNKKSREVIILQAFWNKGMRKMVEHTVDYSYGGELPLPSGRSKTVTGYRFNGRGTTFGASIGFPIYFAKKKLAQKLQLKR